MIAEQLAVRAADAGQFLPSHWVATKKEWTVTPRKSRCCFLRDAQLGAACVSHKRMARRKLGHLWKDIEGCANWKRNVNQIGFRYGIPERTRRSLINDAAAESFVGNVRAIPAVN